MTRILDSLSEQLPTDAEPCSVDSRTTTKHRPLAMKLATVPTTTTAVDVSALIWDEQAQVMLMRDGSGMSPSFKHTSTHTSTTTGSHDRQGPDSDSDSTGR